MDSILSRRSAEVKRSMGADNPSRTLDTGRDPRIRFSSSKATRAGDRRLAETGGFRFQEPFYSPEGRSTMTRNHSAGLRPRINKLVVKKAN
ncbi:hypothetical protein [Amycolatopsis sp. NPDC051102]|uniref:hypothetical protein n=1 Tax=Amycolatopsis sp. NPDC051102 TaxID=3155163 RepID=UPI0034151B0F